MFFVHFGRFGRFIVYFNDLERFVMTQLMLTFKFEAANVNFQQFWTFSTNFKILCCLTVLVVCEQALNNWKRFDTNWYTNYLSPHSIWCLVMKSNS